MSRSELFSTIYHEKKGEVIMRRLCLSIILLVVGIASLLSTIAMSNEISRLRSDAIILEAEIDKLRAEIGFKGNLIEQYKMMLAEKDNNITKLQEELLEIRSKIDKPILDHVSRGGFIRKQKMHITAYDLSVESCGKTPDHPEYGITASGKIVKDWHTVAMGPNIPFGTKIYIPYFKDKPNRGIFVKDDTGVPHIVHDGVVDIFIRDHKTMEKFGVKYLDVYFLE